MTVIRRQRESERTAQPLASSEIGGISLVRATFVGSEHIDLWLVATEGADGLSARHIEP